MLGRADSVPPAPQMAVPLLTVQVHAESREAQYPALVAALQELTDEDPLLDLQWLQEERELHVKVMGAIPARDSYESLELSLRLRGLQKGSTNLP